MIEKYRCLTTCSPFIQGENYCGRLIIIDLFGEKMEIYEMYPHDGEKPIIMPCEYFKEVPR